MCEITRENFQEYYPQIINDLHSACFLSIDCEFSGLFGDTLKCSLFDTPKERYEKLQISLKSYSIVQLGLSTFHYDRTKNGFNASTYTFYLMPLSLLEIHSKIIYDVESIEFLCKHKFDFNKVFYNGISYTNKCEEAKVSKMVLEGSLIKNFDREKKKKIFSEIENWLSCATEGSELIITLENDRDVTVLSLHLEIRKKFSNVWTYYSECNILKIKKISELHKLNLLQEKKNMSLCQKLLDSVLGFSKILNEIEGLKLPIIGHNCLIDFIMIYKQFYNQSSMSYKDFKCCITKIFPCIYDTKTISFNLREILPKEKVWKSNSLPDLYLYFKKGEGASLALFTPQINHTNNDFVENENYHDAGFDSYCTGICFIKMAHLYSLWNPAKKIFESSSIKTTSTWLLAAVAPMKNHLNISMGQVNEIILDGSDPKSKRPNFLYVQSTNNLPLDFLEVSKIIEKIETVDLQPLNKFTIVLAPSNHRVAKELLKTLKKHPKIKASKYNFFKHSDLGKTIIAGTVFTSVILWLVFNLKKTKFP